MILRGDSHQLGREQTSKIRSLFRSWVIRRLFKHFAAFACVGQANRAFYRQHGVPETKLFTVPHCVDNDRFGSVPPTEVGAWRKELGISADELLTLFAGKFEPKKRPDLLLAAFLETQRTHEKLVFVGGGEMEPMLRDMGKNYQESVIFAGFANQSQMPRILAAADLLVLPSFGPGETWGLVVNEAMAAGTPAVVSDHVGCAADLILANQTGWTFEAGNRADLAKTLRLALSEIVQNRERFRRSTRALISNYSYSAATKGLVDLINNLRLSPSKT
mgnify:FL=1